MADPTLFAAPGAAAHGAAGGGVEITITLLIVVGFLAGLAWFARRMRGVNKYGAARIQMLAAQSLGPKERVVLVRIGETDILVGVAAGSVNALHVFAPGANTEAPAAPAAGDAAGQPNFKALLLKALGK